MKTKKPTLAEIQEAIISCLKNNEAPKKGDASQFFMLAKSWQDEMPLSLKRRQIFATIFNAYKRRCVAKDEVRRKNEMWAAINAVIAEWGEHKDAILPLVKSKKHSTPLFPSLSFNPFKKEDYADLTWINH